MDETEASPETTEVVQETPAQAEPAADTEGGEVAKTEKTGAEVAAEVETQGDLNMDFLRLEGMGYDPNKITLAEAQNLLTELPNLHRIEELDATLNDLVEDHGGDFDAAMDALDEEQLDRLKNELEENPRLVEALKVVAKMNEGSSMSRFIDNFFGGAEGMSLGGGGSLEVNENPSEVINLSKFKDKLKENSFAEKLSEAYRDDKFKSASGLDSEDKKKIDLAVKGDKKALFEVMQAMIKNLFESSGEDRLNNWPIIAEELGEKLSGTEGKKKLSSEVYNYFLDIYDNKETLDLGDIQRIGPNRPVGQPASAAPQTKAA